ncbi:ferrous iron transport protein A [Candidatus Dojkabacteria bacterium]|nr:ferrous iron transport protein A [Candidatus Dojkabacteria bacterium]
MNLNELKSNQKAKVVKINLPHSIRERLHSMGLIEGVDIIMTRESPMRSPKIYEIMNTYIAVRNNLAQKIEIKVEGE